ncbi:MULTISPECIES: GNAT family N-acetyltransferase [Mesorhizobium]|uniref:GNAT family N-acetyltransferase n=1 Tax=Mesorhizobium denitrificans TaxID=2294114 RepID=A0A371X6M2_9HYPH|nr:MULTISPECIES: GNAT family N-acetyltransferase [Mesorhizobium]RFC64861.1 GNAT family N-acetyltransferase [Mesorhizobium denitrificans]
MQTNSGNQETHFFVVRQLRPSEKDLFRDHLLRLDRESRTDRFNGGTKDDFLIAYADRSFSDGTSVIGVVNDGRVIGAAELHEKPEPDGEPTAEIAFSVENEWQHRGLGGLLFERLIQTAIGLGYRRLRVTTHSQNAAMKALARRFGAKLTFEFGETVGLIELEDAVHMALPIHARTDFWHQRDQH